jgi:hypothetical protein
MHRVEVWMDRIGLNTRFSSIQAFLYFRKMSNKALHLTPTRVTLPAGRYAPVQEARHGSA